MESALSISIKVAPPRVSGDPALSGQAYFATSVDFLRTGIYWRSNGYVNNRTTEGNWWSSTANSDTNAYNLYTNTGKVNAQNNTYRGNGNAVRCVAALPQFPALPPPP